MLGKIGNEIHYHSKENPILLATSHNNKLEIWNLGGLLTDNVAFESAVEGADFCKIMHECETPVVDFAFAPDGTACAVATLDGFVSFIRVTHI